MSMELFEAILFYVFAGLSLLSAVVMVAQGRRWKMPLVLPYGVYRWAFEQPFPEH